MPTIILAVIFIAAIIYSLIYRPLPRINGTVRVRGLEGKVEVIRDRWGVPHIYAEKRRTSSSPRATCTLRIACGRWSSTAVWQASTVPGFPTRPAAIIPTYRQIIDLGNWERSVAVNSTGQSGQLGSRHYADMIELWRTGSYHPMLWERASIEREAEGRLIMLPQSRPVTRKRPRRSEETSEVR